MCVRMSESCIYTTSQGQFFRGEQLNLIQRFPFLWQVAIRRLKSPICATIHPKRDGGYSQTHTFPSGIGAMWKAKSLELDLKFGHWVYFQWRDDYSLIYSELNFIRNTRLVTLYMQSMGETCFMINNMET